MSKKGVVDCFALSVARNIGIVAIVSEAVCVRHISDCLRDTSTISVNVRQRSIHQSPKKPFKVIEWVNIIRLVMVARQIDQRQLFRWREASDENAVHQSYAALMNTNL